MPSADSVPRDAVAAWMFDLHRSARSGWSVSWSVLRC